MYAFLSLYPQNVCKISFKLMLSLDYHWIDKAIKILRNYKSNIEEYHKQYFVLITISKKVYYHPKTEVWTNTLIHKGNNTFIVRHPPSIKREDQMFQEWL